MANDIPGPVSTTVEKFRTAIRVHKCEALHCPYCLIRDWVNEVEEELSQIIAISNEETSTGVYKDFEGKQLHPNDEDDTDDDDDDSLGDITRVVDEKKAKDTVATELYEQKMADFNRKLTADFDPDASTA